MIQRFFVHNYRCFENFSLDLSDKDSLLVLGRNGAGKSTLLNALRVIQGIGRGTPRVGSLVNGLDFSTGRFGVPMRFEVSALLRDKLFAYAIAFEFPRNFREARVVSESLTIDGVLVFQRTEADVQLESGASFRLDWHVPALPVIHLQPGSDSIDQLKSFFADMVLISPVPANMTGYSAEETGELDKDASNIASWIFDLLGRRPAAYQDIVHYLQQTIPDLSSFGGEPRGDGGRQLQVHFEQDNADPLIVDFRQLSDGEKCFFLSAAIIAWVKHRSSSVGPLVCMWDEPDNHLSLAEVGHFIMQLRKQVRRPNQFLATSHHPEAIRRFSDENTVVLARQSHLEPTVVRWLSEISYSGDLGEALIRNEILP